MHVFVPSSDPILPRDLPPVFVVSARWITKPSDQQIAKVKALFPSLKSFSTATLKRKALDHSSFDLGRFTDEEMLRHEPALRILGIEIERTPV
jgi:hypothetical protein